MARKSSTMSAWRGEMPGNKMKRLIFSLIAISLLAFLASIATVHAASCNSPNQKKSLTIPGEYDWSGFMTWAINQGNPMCTPSVTYVHDWRIGWASYGGKYYQIPFVWDESNVTEWCNETSGSFNGMVFFANEPTLSGQADMTPEETAQMALNMLACTPNAKLIGPNHHPTVLCTSDWMDDFWAEFTLGGGTATNIYRLGYHGYINPCGSSVPQDQIDQFQAMLPSALASKAIFVSEVGWNNGNLEEWTEEWMDKWMAIPEVGKVFGYTAFRPEVYPDPWVPYFLHNPECKSSACYTITETGLGYKASGW